MPEQMRQDERPELGFVSVGQYLDANRGTLDQQFQSDNSQFRGNPQPGQQNSTSTQDLIREFGSQAGLAGSGRFGPMGPESAFNSGLEWAAHGPGYQALSQYLDQQQQNQAANPPVLHVNNPKPPPGQPAPDYIPGSTSTPVDPATAAQTHPRVAPRPSAVPLTPSGPTPPSAARPRQYRP